MTRLEKIIFSFVALSVLVGLVWAHVDHQTFSDIYTVEDGYLEWLTVVALFCGFIFNLYRCYYFHKSKSIFPLLVTLILAMVCLFGAGEEISWGQRIFNIDSPEFFTANNAQHETNLHNLKLGGVKINKLIFGKLLSSAVILYFLIIPVLYWKIGKFKNLLNKFGIPVPRWYHAASLLAVFIISELTFSPKKGEILEFGSCWIFLLTIYNPINKMRFPPNEAKPN